MLQSTGLENRILEAMRKGARLFFHVRMVGTWNDGYSYVYKTTLEHNGKEITLSHSEDLPGGTRPDAEYYRREIVGRFESFANHPELRSEYCDYRSDYATQWREMYVHINTPTPRWITEQWATPVSQHEL